MNRIAIFGLGYVGCVSAACLGSAGHQVLGVDLNKDKVDMINQGKSPIVEPGLDELLSSVVDDGRLRATLSCEEAVHNSDIGFICVGTPGDANGQLQLADLNRVSREIGLALRGSSRPYTVVVRSTVLPGTVHSEVYIPLLASAGASMNPFLKVAVNPEFLREGTALKDFADPPMTLVGTDDAATAELLRSIYEGLNAPFIHTTINTAEAVKYVSNSYHALKVCFANEIGDILTQLGADQQEVMRIFRMDRKLNISDAYLRPGFAFGGSCLPKDLKALLYAAHHLNVPLPLLEAIMPSNEAQIHQAVDAVFSLGKRRIGVVGLSFKADTDDLRGSPLVALVEALIGKGCLLRIFDANVAIARLTGANKRYIIEEIPHISTLMCDSKKQLIEHAEVLVIGSDTSDSRWVREHARAGQIIVDLTRSHALTDISVRAAA